ncbi:armadillo repeat-containing protein 10 isoform X1 [Rhincodon typus]|uniref:armadillo repeat-containing protein 10 isoform X1 n=1 Tax=Rhincodon typus TaxID=259920 RepID=UPI00202E8ABF|nr:armadillo repeat-containing protein 10 isoform X1 [Rhincodon typus]
MGSLADDRRWTVRLAVGLLAGAVGLYGLHKLVTLKRRRQQQQRAGGERPSEKNPVHRVTGLKITGDAQRIAEGFLHTNSPDVLEQQHLQAVLGLLKESSDASTREQALVTLGNSAAFSANQDLLRNLDGLSIIANCLFDEVISVRVKALNVLNNLSMNIANQKELKMTPRWVEGLAVRRMQRCSCDLDRLRIWIPQILEILRTTALNSELQVASLRVLTNFSVTNNYHYMMTNYIPHFLKLLVEGTEKIKVQILKLLINLSANPDICHDLLSAQAPLSFLLLFDSCVSKEVLLRLLILVANLKENLSLLRNSVQYDYEVDSLHSVLFGNATPFSHKLTKLILYQDNEVKQQIARIITK